MRALVQRLPVAALVVDDTGRFVAVNAAAARLTGYPQSELSRLSMWRITPGVREHEAEVLWRAFLETNEQTGEYRILRGDGRVIVADYAARARVVPGVHISLLQRREAA